MGDLVGRLENLSVKRHYEKLIEDLDVLEQEYDRGEGLEKEAICPISQGPIIDPVCLSSGIIIEKSSYLDSTGK